MVDEILVSLIADSYVYVYSTLTLYMYMVAWDHSKNREPALLYMGKDRTPGAHAPTANQCYFLVLDIASIPKSNGSLLLQHEMQLHPKVAIVAVRALFAFSTFLPSCHDQLIP